MKIKATVMAMLCATMFSLPAIANSHHISGNGESLSEKGQMQSPLVGAWKMVKFETGSINQMKPVPYSGQLIITSAGTLSAQAMNPEGNAPDTEYTKDGYEALYGRININDLARVFTITVDSSLTRNLIGKKMERAFTVTGNTLVLSPIDKSEGWRVTYQRY